MSDIDFTAWTDMQLQAGSSPRVIEASPVHGPALLAEIQRRKDAGVWMTDGSKERVEALVASVRKPRRRSTRR